MKNRGGMIEASAPLQVVADPVTDRPGAEEKTPEDQDDVDVYIPKVRSPGPYSRGGRPSVLTPSVKEEICKLLSIGLSRRQAAAWIDIDASTISHLAARDPDFARSINRAEELAIVQPMMVLAAASRTSWRAAAFLIKQNARRKPQLTEEEKDQKLEERLADRRRELELRRREKILEEEIAEAERERREEADRAWNRAMLAKEKAEREERRRRKAERLRKEAEQQRQTAGG